MVPVESSNGLPTGFPLSTSFQQTHRDQDHLPIPTHHRVRSCPHFFPIGNNPDIMDNPLPRCWLRVSCHSNHNKEDRIGISGCQYDRVEKCGKEWGKVWHAGVSQVFSLPLRYVTSLRNSAGIFSRLPHSIGPILLSREM